MSERCGWFRSKTKNAEYVNLARVGGGGQSGAEARPGPASPTSLTGLKVAIDAADGRLLERGDLALVGLAQLLLEVDIVVLTGRRGDVRVAIAKARSEAGRISFRQASQLSLVL